MASNDCYTLCQFFSCPVLSPGQTALRCPRCDHEYHTPHTRTVRHWLRDHARRNVIGRVESIRQTMTEARTELLQHDTHIAHLRATLSQPDTERAKLEDFIHTTRLCYPSIRRVPTAILTLIFAMIRACTTASASNRPPLYTSIARRVYPPP